MIAQIKSKNIKHYLLVSILFIFIIQNIPLISAQVITQTQPEISDLELMLTVNISSKLDIINNDDIKELTINYSFYPKKDTNSEIITQEFNPDYAAKTVNENYVLLTLEKPKKDITYGSYTILNNKLFFPKIETKVKFPIPKDIIIEQQLDDYIKPSEFIDSDNPEIINIATSLAENEDDLYIVVFKLANWTLHNINYNLSTLTEDVTQPASWVLQNREGVCDELTNLFIAYARSLGIPARFVSGVAYTNSPLFPSNWGGHAWAEVYFPGYDWVPFDVTYKQLGWIDASHITMDKSYKSSSVKTQYQWSGYNLDNVKVSSNPLDYDVKVISKKGKLQNGLNYNLYPLKTDIGFGSYNIITLIIKNTNPYYVTEKINIIGTEDLEFLTPAEDYFLLRPYEKKVFNFIIKVPAKLDKNYIYTYPVQVYDSHNNSIQTIFNVSSTSQVYSLNEIKALLSSLTKDKTEKAKKTNINIDINCNIKNKININNTKNFSCKFTNIGNVNLKDVKLCYKDNCINKEIKISQETEAVFQLYNITTGSKEIIISATVTSINYTTSKTYYTEIIDNPKLEIKNISYPSKVSFKDMYNLTFTIVKSSYSNPEKVLIALPEFNQQFELNNFKDKQKVVIKLFAKELNEGQNNLTLEIKYFPENERQRHKENIITNPYNEYITKTTYIIELQKLTFIEKFEYWLIRLNKSLEHIFNKANNKLK